MRELVSMAKVQLHRLHRFDVWRMMLGLFWLFLQFLVTIQHLGVHLVQLLRCFFISRGLMNKYRALPLHKIKYLAIVVDSEEAVDTFRIRNLLELFANMGIRNVILYDMDGVLKRSESSLKKGLDSASLSWMSLEVLSYADGKEALAKAASFICSKYLEDDDLLRETEALTLSESDISDALRRVGGDGPEPELLLVFAPVRCHLGFPAWRMRYTEIVHMGALKSLKPGALIKAIHDLSKKTRTTGSRLLGFADGLDEGGGGEGFDVAVAEAGGGGAVAEELEGVVDDVAIDGEDGGHVGDLEVGAEEVEGDQRAGGVVGGGGGEEGSLELGQVAGEGGRGPCEERGRLERPGREGGDEPGRLERRGLSWARRRKSGWSWTWRSSTILPHEPHSVTHRPQGVFLDRPCVPLQKGHCILSLYSLSFSL